MGVKISELDSVSDIHEGCCLPIVSDGETRKLSYGTLKSKLKNDLKLSDFDNDEEFIDNTVDNLLNYYLKTETYNKTETYTRAEVNQIINNISKVTIQIVNELPATGETNVIYFVPKTAKQNDVYDEYIYINNNWEHIGSTDVDLSSKQDLLVSGENIKTINNQSLLGSGNIDIQGGGGATGDTLPIGSIIPYGNATAPTGWLVCDGSFVSKTTYAELYAVIGDSYLDGETPQTGKFRLPNKKGKVSVGLDTNDLEFEEIGMSGGEKTHTLSVNEMPSHHHNANTQGQTGSSNYYFAATQYGANQMQTEKTGGDQPHNNLQPYQVDQWIIKAFQSAGVVAEVENTESDSRVNTYSCDYVNALKNIILQSMYPVGSIYISTTLDTAIKVHNALGGTWVAWGSGKVPVGVNTSDTDFNTVEKTGGEKTHTLSVNEMPSHRHNVTLNQQTTGETGLAFDWSYNSERVQGYSGDSFMEASGGNQPHNNLQPYITCYMWKRTA